MSSLKYPDFSPVQNKINLERGNGSFSSCITKSQSQLSWRPAWGFSQGHYFMIFPRVIEDNSSQNARRLSVVCSTTWKWLAPADILEPGLVEAQ